MGPLLQLTLLLKPLLRLLQLLLGFMVTLALLNLMIIVTDHVNAIILGHQTQIGMTLWLRVDAMTVSHHKRLPITTKPFLFPAYLLDLKQLRTTYTTTMANLH